jgi:hypothetical protein
LKLGDAWKSVSHGNIHNSIAASGFDEDESKWHIYKHDVYGEQFHTCWKHTGGTEPNLNDF